ncbi:DUF922 domain-containing protein [Pedobacter gandavensis]|uniref:DUF922 domain-containing protein n=1 Tax=Pedobacter gandavensis TaxID=2679963 RepID=A0ABR6ERL2_9SPHI|nr:DUF922 domain-containing protein [Pedobacter gandavensis]MBB2147891.1 DUF922 domain-containing protein [Pedobacter gandavensis]
MFLIFCFFVNMKRATPLLLSISIFLFCGFLKSEKAFSQENQLNRINLKWNMYQQLEQTNRPFIAYTAHQTTHKYRATQKGSQFSLKFTVGVALDSKKSTLDLRKLASLDEEGQKKLLNHEQGHSDLAVVYGRILYKQLSKQVYTVKNYQNEVKKIYDDTMKELLEMNFKYDIETSHGEELEPQDKWDLYFKNQLKINALGR